MSENLAPPSSKESIVMRMANFSLPPSIVALGGVEKYQRVLDEVRGGDPQVYAGGYDLTPTRRLVLDEMCGRFAGLRSCENDSIVAFASGIHQTWPCGMVENWRDKRGSNVANLAYLAVMPERRSFRAMQRMAEAVDATTMTVYPGLRDKQGNLESYKWCADKAAVQLEPDAIQQMGAEYNMDVFFESLRSRGAGRIIVDNHHITRSNVAGDYRMNWKGVLEKVEEARVPIVGLHVSAGRSDAGHADDIDQSRTDLEALMQAPQDMADRIMGKIIARSCEIWSRQRKAGIVAGPLYVTTEIPHKSLARQTGGKTSIGQFADLHRTIALNLQEYVRSCV